MKTILGKEIPETTRGVVYLCHIDFLIEPPKLTVFREILCEDAFHALTLYAEIPNPPSQLVTGRTYDELCKRLEILHEEMKSEKWLKELIESI
jgi:hypothetical protein